MVKRTTDGTGTNREDLPEGQDSKAIARPRPNERASSPDDEESTPSKPKFKPKFELEKLETATSSIGEVFSSGDLIQVKDLKGNPTTAKIEYFYAEPRGMMAVYVPAEEQEAGWVWEQGCCLVDTLIGV